jgi:hypothetical protein
MDDIDRQIEVDNPNPNGFSGRTGLIIFIALLALGLIGTGLYAYAEHQNGKCLIAQLKTLEKAQQVETAHKPRPFLTPEMRADLDRAIVAAQHPDAGTSAQVAQATDAGAVETSKPLAKKVEKNPAIASPPAAMPNVMPEFDGTGYAVRIHTLWNPNQPWYEKQDTAQGLMVCSRIQKIDLELFIRQVDGKKKMPVLVEGYPPMDEVTAKKTTICLTSAIHVPGQENHFEVVKASDFMEGYSDVAIPDKKPEIGPSAGKGK